MRHADGRRLLRRIFVFEPVWKKAWKSSSGYVTILCGKTEQLSEFLSMLQRNLPQVLRDEMLESMVAEAIPAGIPGIIRQ